MSERSFRITPGEPVPDEVRRVARGRIDHATDELRGNSESSRAAAVHEARKDMKKLRAVLRLVLVAHRFRVAAGSTRPSVQTAIDTLTEARARVNDWPLDTDGFEAFEE